MKPAVYIKSSMVTTFKSGHPWIFPKAIVRKEGPLMAGAWINIFDTEGVFLGSGVYNPHSLYCVRVLAYAFEIEKTASLVSVIKMRLQEALSVRESLNLPSDKTTAYRLFNSEGDGLSGLTIDRFNHICVIASSAFWVEEAKDLIISCLKELLPHDELLWRPQIKALKQDGWQQELPAVLPRQEVVLEAGVQFYVDFEQAQKTGLFIDQRENHERIARLAKGKKVLDLYSYTGGFALHAAKAGAIKVTAVDSSQAAIDAGRRNSELNGLSHINWIVSDAREYLAHAADYDIITLDPPKLVPSKRHLQQAKNYYRFLHREVFKVMRSGSLLMTCNCSSAISSDVFCELVYQQARAAGKAARVIGVYGPSSCHPTLPVFPEGQYLTALLIAIA